MNDLRDRFRALDEIELPDTSTWRREPRPATRGPSPARRFATMAVAFAVAVAGVTFVIRAFRAGMDQNIHEIRVIRNCPASRPESML